MESLEEPDEHLCEPIADVAQCDEQQDDRRNHFAHIIGHPFIDQPTVSTAQIEREFVLKGREEQHLYAMGIHTAHDHDDTEVNEQQPQADGAGLLEHQFQHNTQEEHGDEKAEHAKEVVHKVIGTISSQFATVVGRVRNRTRQDIGLVLATGEEVGGHRDNHEKRDDQDQHSSCKAIVVAARTHSGHALEFFAQLGVALRFRWFLSSRCLAFRSRIHVFSLFCHS